MLEASERALFETQIWIHSNKQILLTQRHTNTHISTSSCYCCSKTTLPLLLVFLLFQNTHTQKKYSKVKGSI